MKKKVVPFSIYKDRKGKYRWRVTAENGRILAQSSESYTRRIDCLNGAVLTLDILCSTDSVYNRGLPTKELL